MAHAKDSGTRASGLRDKALGNASGPHVSDKIRATANSTCLRDISTCVHSMSHKILSRKGTRMQLGRVHAPIFINLLGYNLRNKMVPSKPKFWRFAKIISCNFM